MSNPFRLYRRKSSSGEDAVVSNASHFSSPRLSEDAVPSKCLMMSSSNVMPGVTFSNIMIVVWFLNRSSPDIDTSLPSCPISELKTPESLINRTGPW